GSIRKFRRPGAPLGSCAVTLNGKPGVGWITLSADQCTLLYTGQTDVIRRFNVCTNTQITNFATSFHTPALQPGFDQTCSALRIRPNAEVIVACDQGAIRLGTDGSVLRAYPTPGDVLVGLDLDPDGLSFWAASSTGVVRHLDVATGAQIAAPGCSAVGVRGL